MTRRADPRHPEAWRAGTVDGTPGRSAGLAGDVNGDGRLNLVDFGLVCAAIHTGQYDVRFDFNNDQHVDVADHQFFVENLVRIPIGDANLDGRFNSQDLVLVFQIGQYNDAVAQNSTWSTGDWNCDREFSSADWVLALQRTRYEA